MSTTLPKTMAKPLETKIPKPGEMRRLRSESSKRAQKLTQQEAHTQMQQNGSVSSPNPWYRELPAQDGL